MSQLHSKQSVKAPSSENSLATGGSFERNTFKERKKEGSGYFYGTVNATHLAILTATPEIN